jgi:HNH endonuclease
VQATPAYKLPRGHKRPPRGSTVLQRFEFYVIHSEEPDGCWLWRGGTLSAKHGNPYGTFWNGTKPVLAHRWSYEHFVGPIPDGLVIDHTCETPACVRPDHLEPVTNAVNIIRGGQWPHNPDIPRAERVNREANRPNCAKCGTPYTTDKNGKRYCPACHKASHREWRLRTHGTPEDPGARNRSKTRCPAGHEYTPENTYVNPTNGSRQCRACKNERRRVPNPPATAKTCPPGCTCGRHRRAA